MDQIPLALRRYFADSQLTLESYSCETGKLVIHIEKDIGLEVGLIALSDVSYLSARTCFPGEDVQAIPILQAGEDFWRQISADRDCFDRDDVLFEFHDQEGHIHRVVAKAIEYKILSP